MVLNRKPDNQALRYLLGICIIAVSIYVFYISVSKRNSPELFLIPVVMDPKGEACTMIATERFAACIPIGIDCLPRNGRLELYSAKSRIRGSIEILDRLPQEKEWRTSLHNPFIKAFIGDVRRIGTYELMDAILKHRYNPTLMGAKAILIPTWMKHTNTARILTLPEDKGLVFYTPIQSLGLKFMEGSILMLSMKGNVPAESLVGLVKSIKLSTPAGQRTGSKHAS
jgi:hypothetical protein